VSCEAYVVNIRNAAGADVRGVLHHLVKRYQVRFRSLIHADGGACEAGNPSLSTCTRSAGLSAHLHLQSCPR
jgi:hypothetical protein